MNTKRYIIGLLATMVLLTGCGESLEDTYSDLAGDGRVRYLGKCSALSVTSGWKRLHAEWKNSTDVVIDSIKVEWTVADLKRDTLLEPTVSSLDLVNLEDGSYCVEVYAIGKDKSKSLVETAYARPYTESHEVVRTFTNAITKFYKVKSKNALVFFLDKWNDNIVDIRLNYTNTSGEEKAYPLTKTEFAKEYITLEEIDVEKPITISREGKVEGCPDVIHFTPLELDNQRNYTSDFKIALQRRYGISDKTEAQKLVFEHFIDTVRTLEFDYDMTTFEDILFCPKLEKIVLGKNRYLNSTYSSFLDVSLLYEEPRSIAVLNEAYRLEEVTVERYNNHYFTDVDDFNPGVLIEMGKTELPLLLPSDLEVEKVECSIKEAPGWESNLDGLVDDRADTYWMPIEGSVHMTGIRAYEITISYKEPQMARGFKVVQAPIGGNDQYMLPGLIKIQVSEDGRTWKNATHLLENTLGRGVGEVTLLPLAEPRKIKYVRVNLNDQVRTENGYSSIALSDIIPY